ncbi:hypothetical protein BD410DRAFT_757508 [Rickenella mellea]|uniref:Uncharacterized protein n=1 Tax=Rickenella mellea TaxID=50990 RepID=A0A4Y7PED6_9AGAM|nr:hypothetical protein BD410DRAFT_757508 [Rickenella mellea]
MGQVELLYAILDKPLLTDVLFGHFSAAEIIRMSWTCWAARKSVQSYSSRAWSIDRHLRRFFRDPSAFRSLQAQTGTLISGSNALQFIDRTFYPESDLDIYVFPREHLTVGKWILEEAGMDYAFQPNSSQDPDFEKAEFAAPDDDDEQDAMDVEDEEAVYRMKGMLGVFTFISQMDDLVAPLKVQMIVTQVCPLDTVLSFHSTVVMNIISYQAAYCLFAWTTLEDRHGVVVEAKKTRHEAALAKYAARGFHIVSGEEAKCDENHRHRSSLRFGERWVDDRLTWVIPLDMTNVNLPAPTLGTPNATFDPVTLNSWTFGLKYVENPPVIQCRCLSSKLLRFNYIASHSFLRFARPVLHMTGSTEYKKREEYPNSEFWTWWDFLVLNCKECYFREPKKTRPISDIIRKRIEDSLPKAPRFISRIRRYRRVMQADEHEQEDENEQTA